MNADELYRAMARKRKRLGQHEVLVLLTAFMGKHGLHGWTGRIGIGAESGEDRLLGRCDLDHKVIWITRWAIRNRTPAQIKDTILHEIAHALLEEEGHLNSGHDMAWIEKAAEIGVRESYVLEVCLRKSVRADSVEIN